MSRNSLDRSVWRRWAVGLLLAIVAIVPSGSTRARQAPSREQSPSKGQKPPPARRDDIPKVISRAKAAGQTSPFLRPPGASRYDEDPLDWRDVPPWRQASFFGIRARGRFFVYVVDCSGSMIDEDRLARAKAELRRSVQDLRDPQRFQVIFYNDKPIPMPGGLPQSAVLDAKSRFLAWLRLIEPDGETDPRPALGMAISLRPDAIFLLSDGEYPEGTAAGVAAQNARRIPIHCVDLSGGLAGDQLGRIARDSGGTYVARPWPGP